MSAGPESARGLTRGICEMTLEARDPWSPGVDHHGPAEHEGGDRSVYFEDPEGNVVETWDFFEHGDGAREGVGALEGDGAAA